MIEGLRGAFDAGVRPAEQWAAPRGTGWQHALVDLDPVVQRVCRLPIFLAAIGRALEVPFLFSQIEGREPLGPERATSHCTVMAWRWMPSVR